jgi:hypothetical protein
MGGENQNKECRLWRRKERQYRPKCVSGAHKRGRGRTYHTQSPNKHVRGGLVGSNDFGDEVGCHTDN